MFILIQFNLNFLYIYTVKGEHLHMDKIKKSIKRLHTFNRFLLELIKTIVLIHIIISILDF